jgi:hypothetical protein
MCSESAKPIHGGDRPGWFSKEKCLASAAAAAGPSVKITVLYDGDTMPTWLSKYPVTVHQIFERSGDGSFIAQIQYAVDTIKNPNTIVYILEDDYLHIDGWSTILREAFDEENIEPHVLKPSYVTLYDHLDKYIYSMYSELMSRIAITPSRHWRTVPSTTNTFACLLKTLKEDASIHIDYKNKDHTKFLKLGSQKGRVVISPMPAASTHAGTGFLSPCVDWNKV